jgi:NTE family protein
MASMSNSTRRALVLGAGGHAATAWELGVIAGLADEGVDVRDADLFVGTSAGSIVGAQITSGIALEELFQRQADPRRQSAEAAPSIDFVRWRTELTRAKEEAADRADFLRRMGAFALSTDTASEAERRRVIASRLPRHEWPAKRLCIAAVAGIWPRDVPLSTAAFTRSTTPMSRSASSACSS